MSGGYGRWLALAWVAGVLALYLWQFRDLAAALLAGLRS